MSRFKIMAAAAIALAAVATTSGAAYAMLQAAEAPARLRATGLVGEQWDGYMGLVGSAPAAVRDEMDAINIQRRAEYTRLARLREKTIEEVAAASGCDLFATKVLPGQYYQLPDGVWRRRNGTEPVPRPQHCG